MRRKVFTSFASLRSMRQSPTARRVQRPRSRFAFRMLKRIKVKGGREGRLGVAPAYGRQLERFLSA